MQISSRFTLAVHIILCIDIFNGEYKTTSDFLASSTNVNPVVVRRLLGQLKAAGIVEVARGSGGATITKPMSNITFLDVYKAVECNEGGELFHFHEKPNEDCPVGHNIHNVLDKRLNQVQRAMEKELDSITLADIETELEGYLDNTEYSESKYQAFDK